MTRLFRKRAQIHLYIGTILDADGTPSGSNTHDRSSGVPIMRGFMSLRRVELRVNNDVPRVFLPPPCEAHAPPTFRSGAGKRLKCILCLSFALLFEFTIAYVLGFFQGT